ncbi:MAG: tRNA (cytidine(34)-2'-O)-methyltransferase [Magnetococcales bacterium]|nr:tRNA (cytidine(34)-2'-O)-methyltransferase [Magnetococcales bacterium]
MLRVVLFQPEIPQNAGAVLRTCAATSSELHLIGPLGFRLDSAGIRRAGMDYRAWAMVRRWDDWSAFEAGLPDGARVWVATTKANHAHVESRFGPEDWLLFGPEGSGLPVEILTRFADHAIRIPMHPKTRSLNLAQSVAVVLYEALRQNGFPDMR